MSTILTSVVLVALAAGWSVTARLAMSWWHRLHTDPLTGLANRDALTRAFRRAIRRSAAVGVLLLDLDEFKAINDRHGHDVGNHVLWHVATRLAVAAGPGALPVRLHGDEFAVLLPNLAFGQAGLDAAQHRAAGIAAAISTPLDLPGHTPRITASVGAAVAPAHTADLSLLLRVADQRMYATKTGTRAGDVVGRWSA